MKNRINLHLIQYAINSILRQKSKNIFIHIIFVILTFLLSSVFFITNSIKYELNTTVDSLPQIIVQNVKAGKIYDINTNMINNILEINGVNDVNARVWGYYYFNKLDVYFTLMGLDTYENQYKQNFTHIVNNYDLEKPLGNQTMLVGIGVKKALSKAYYMGNYFNFIKPNGTIKKLDIIGTFKNSTQLESNDMIIMSKESIRDIFDIGINQATDIVVSVKNPEEIGTIVEKIKLKFPNVNIITNEDLKISYQNIFNYKSGIFLTLFIICLFTFFIIIYDKASGLNSEEKKEIGILKAIGWTTDDILKEKFYEGFIISFFAYIIGTILAFIFVYFFQAPLLRDIFEGYSTLKASFELPFILDFQTLFLVFFLSVPIYISATIIPSWRISTLEADEVIR
ncbi:MAG TPA: ABC transporter permease [Arcobacter sp.]|nr:ABC transporter permease [Arcobacter sp.]HIP55667.1 ABC transporter permease [Arcobacter sp.]